MSLANFFAILEKRLAEVKKKEVNLTEDEFVDRVISYGNKYLNEVKDWEPVHFRVRQEHGREKSVQQPERMLEIIEILRKNTDITLEEVDKLLEPSGMALGIIDKIYILNSRLDYNRISMQRLVSNLKEFEDYGFGNDPRTEVRRLQQESQEIEAKISTLKAEYRKIFPKKEIFK